MSLLSDVAGSPLFQASGGAGRYNHFRIVPVRHPWRHIGTLVSVLIIVGVINSVMGNPRWEWNVFAEWFLSTPVLAGLGRTLLLTALGAASVFYLAAFWPLRESRTRRSWRVCPGSISGCSARFR